LEYQINFGIERRGEKREEREREKKIRVVAHV
jgi:hypothetical protein